MMWLYAVWMKTSTLLISFASNQLKYSERSINNQSVFESHKITGITESKFVLNGDGVWCMHIGIWFF